MYRELDSLQGRSLLFLTDLFGIDDQPVEVDAVSGRAVFDGYGEAFIVGFGADVKDFASRWAGGRD